MHELSGQQVTSVQNITYLLDEPINQGAQGILFRESSGKYLIKILYERNQHHQEELEKKLKLLCSYNLPPRFIKPLDIIKLHKPQYPYIGYVMAHVKGHTSLNKLLVPDKELPFDIWYNDKTGGLKRRLYIGYQIAQSFALLHQNNLSYCDVSGNNILIAADPKINSVCMVDIDNVYVPGSSTTAILGTLRFIAPEVLNHQFPPDIMSDDYSLALILFELFRCGHPFIGDYVREGSPDLETDAFHGKLPFINDPNLDLNRSTNHLPEKYSYSSALKSLFHKAFIEGKRNRMVRPTAQEFAVACLETSNAVILCKNCGAGYIPTEELLTTKGSICPWCTDKNSQTINSPKPFIKFGEVYPSVDGIHSVDIEDEKNIKKKSVEFKKNYYFQPGVRGC